MIRHRKALVHRDSQRTMIQALESRTLLSGNVTAALNSAGELVITGDNKDNQIQIIAAVNSTFIQELNGTTVNKLANVNVSFPEFPFVRINMGNGNDSVELLDFNQGATVVMGNGNDSVTTGISELSAGFIRRLNIDTGNGDDTVTLRDTLVVGSLDLFTGNGNDTVNVSPTFSFSGPAVVDGGRGFDTIFGEASLFPATVRGFELST